MCVYCVTVVYCVMQEYTDEIERLRRDVLAAREKNGIFISPENLV